jgi:ATP/maltotriose-dependent transcriptional regulator MalT
LIIELITFKVVIIRKIEKKIQLTLLEKLLIEEGKGKIVELEKSIEKIEIDSEKKRLIDKVTLSKKINETLIDPLTKREIEVLNELILGGSQEEIANKLFISKSTLKTHIGNVYSKLNVKNRIEAINKAIQLLA